MKESVPTPDLHSQEAQIVLQKYDAANRLLTIASLALPIGSALLGIYHIVEENVTLPTLPTVIVYCLQAALALIWLAIMLYATIKSARYNPPTFRMIDRYLDDVLERNRETIDIHRNIQTLELYRGTKPSNGDIWLTVEGTDRKISFDLSPLGKRDTLIDHGTTHIECVINQWYADQAATGRIPVNIVFKQMWYSKPIVDPIVVNGTLHKSVKRRLTLLKYDRDQANQSS